MPRKEIKLQEPFKSLYNKGYIFIRPDKRKYIHLRTFNNKNKILSYARYLYGIKLGYEVPSEYEVDHKDNNPFNDTINNLQLLTKVENIKKYRQFYRDNIQEFKYLTCNNCEKEFRITKAEYESKIKDGVTNFYCNRNCYLEKNIEDKIEVNCKHCNKNFSIHRSKYNNDINKNKEFYCSRTCWDKNKLKIIELICSNCNTKFKLKKYKYNVKLRNGNKNFFCSSNCRIKFKQKENKLINCNICNKELEQIDIKYKITNNLTKEEKYHCSKKCLCNDLTMHTV